ncbi:hypothetical protein ACMFMG_007154 [Clarireedia jacksonii]
MPHAQNTLDDAARHFRLVENYSPTPLHELESFIQTWLFFGFLAEAIGATGEIQSRTVTDTDEPIVQDDIGAQTRSQLCEGIYEMLCVPAEDGKLSVVLDAEIAYKFVAMVKARWPTDPRFSQMRFDHMKKASIVAIFEYIGVALTDFATSQGLQYGHFSHLVPKYYENEIRHDMMRHGWCPNDIARLSQILPSQQVAHIARMMDRSSPKRDHSTCSESICKYFQIDLTNYQLLHHYDDCTCEKVHVDSYALTEILEDGDTIVLLRFVGAVENPRVELVRSRKDSPYTAISHVWADGLGNPFENSLHSCKLIHLRDLVSRLVPSTTQDSPLIWLDTLCCPAQDGLGKRLAIEKLPLVYRNAERVLVLDKGLLAYDSQTQEPTEKAMRIFTSGWNRRLWTLQEGALAGSLWFQFADEAVELSELHLEIQKLAIDSIPHANFLLHTRRQFLHFEAFITKPENLPTSFSRMSLLNEALLLRGVTVATDEPLCIGTLMHLDLAKILAVEQKERRMEKVWELLEKSENGIPASIIFLEETKISTLGWRWALKSLLHSENVILFSANRFPHGVDYKRASIVSGGLKVTYPGYRIKIREYGDGKPRNPWPGLIHIPESELVFRDDKLQRTFKVMDISQAIAGREEHKNQDLFPLHDLADSNASGLVINAFEFDGKTLKPVTSGLKSAIFGTTVDSDERLTSSGDVEKAIKIDAKYRVILYPCEDDLSYVYDIVAKCAIQARSHELTDKHIAVYSRLQDECGESSKNLQERMKEDEEFQASKLTLVDYFKATMNRVVQEDERFMKGLTRHMGSDILDHIWKMMADWCKNDYIGESLSEEQVWIVD